jgi:hypothetical protein
MKQDAVIRGRAIAEADIESVRSLIAKHGHRNRFTISKELANFLETSDC